MINIHTIDRVNTKQYIKNVEAHFQYLLNRGHQFDDVIYNRILNRIDGVYKREGDHKSVIYTPFGDTHISKISTGCKAAMLAYFYNGTNKCVCIDECGENAIYELIDISSKYNINICINRSLMLTEQSFRCTFNGEEVSNLDLYILLEENINGKN